MAGKIDCLGRTLAHGEETMVEAKTTSYGIDPDSDYWLRLRYNMQLLQYVDAARKCGHDVSNVIYDVVRKPMISPKEIAELDSLSRKIVVDKDGKRVLKKNGEPRQSGSEADGWTVKTHIETPDEFAARLRDDCMTRPDFYFARREVPILDKDLQDFHAQRKALMGIVTHLRSAKVHPLHPETAWPRTVSSNTCKWCQYSSFCLQNISVNPKNPPDGFAITRFSPELESVNNATSNTETE